MRRVSRVFLDAETVSYVPQLFNVKNPRKQVRVSSLCPLSSTALFLVLTGTGYVKNFVYGMMSMCIGAYLLCGKLNALAICSQVHQLRKQEPCPDLDPATEEEEDSTIAAHWQT